MTRLKACKGSVWFWTHFSLRTSAIAGKKTLISVKLNFKQNMFSLAQAKNRDKNFSQSISLNAKQVK